MSTAKEVCEKIRAVYPDVGECGIDIDVNFDEVNRAWSVHLKKENRTLGTFIEPDDADTCIENKQCLGLGLQIAQLRDNILNL